MLLDGSCILQVTKESDHARKRLQRYDLISVFLYKNQLIMKTSKDVLL